MATTDAQRLNAPKSPFGADLRLEHFSFAEGYRPLSHGSLEHFPRRFMSSNKDCTIAPLLGADPGEVVLVPNATTGVNTVLRNVPFQQDDVVLHFSTIYRACSKTIQSLSELCPISSHQIDITHQFRSAVKDVKASGKRPKTAMFDTVLTFPGALFPWEALVATCKDLSIVSFIDDAHGAGHTNLTHLGDVGPDFMISNCYKWLMVPRGCAVLYVPFRNQKLISSTVPTSWGYEIKREREKMEPQAYFSRLFDKVSTIDNTPYCCILLALKFRSKVCGGEANIRKYCEDLALQGGARMAEILGQTFLAGQTARSGAVASSTLDYLSHSRNAVSRRAAE